jgi:mRNA export factor
MVDLATNPNAVHQVAVHGAPVKAVRWVDSPQGGFLVTGSWDKTIKAGS